MLLISSLALYLAIIGIPEPFSLVVPEYAGSRL